MLKKFDTSKILIFLLFLTVAIVPLIVQGEVVKSSQAEVALTGIDEYRLDVFSYSKSSLIVIFSVLLAIANFNILADALTKGRSIDFIGFIKKPQNIALSLYLVALVLSTVFSPYKEVALKGSVERYESFFVLMGYCLIFFTAMSQVKTIRGANILLYGVMFSSFVVGAIGILQLLGKDPFAMAWFQDIILKKIQLNPDVISVDGLKPTFTKTVYATFYNPNNAGMYGAMLSPLVVGLAMLLPIKSVLKYVALALTPFAIIVLVGSSSLGGILGSAFGIIALTFILALYLIKHKKQLLIMGVGIVTVAIAVGAIAVTQMPMVKDKNYLLYNYVHIDGSTIEINTSKGVAYINHDSESSEIFLLDSDKNVIEPRDVINDEEGSSTVRYYDIPQIGEVTLELYDNIIVFEYISHFLFGIKNDGSFTALMRTEQIFDINEPIPMIGFENMQAFANARGHIWSRSIPLITKNIIIGKGPDTFVLSYPQHDVVGKVNAFHNTFTIVDKPHNMYLQYAINTGLISLLAILAIFITYIITTVKSLVDNKGQCSGHIAALRMSIFASICAYLVAGLATDSVVSVAPVFWCLLGLGFAVNNINDKIIRRV